MSNSAIKPNPSSEEKKSIQVEKMFDSISENYDFMNKMMTLGMDKSWRKKVLKIIKTQQPESVLDIATGTGDMPILLTTTEAKKIIGIDISPGMLEVANKKIEELKIKDRVKVQLQDSENMDFSDNSFDAASVLYGIRNFENLEKGLTEIHRVLKAEGIFVILETSVPEKKFFKWGYLFYTRKILPLIAKLFSDNKTAYAYLSESAINFPYGEKLKDILEKTGFKEVEVLPQFFGASTIYVAKK